MYSSSWRTSQVTKLLSTELIYFGVSDGCTAAFILLHVHMFGYARRHPQKPQNCPSHSRVMTVAAVLLNPLFQLWSPELSKHEALAGHCWSV